MTLLDANATIAFLRAEPAGPLVREILTGPTAMSVINAAEVVDRMIRVHTQRLDELEQDFSLLERTGMRMIPVTDAIAVHAGRLRARYYDRKTCSVSMADCVAAATALREKVELATADRGLVVVMMGEGGEVLALPDSNGVMP